MITSKNTYNQGLVERFEEETSQVLATSLDSSAVAWLALDGE